MLVVVSPAKKMNFDREVNDGLSSEILFEKQAKGLVKRMKTCSSSDLQKMMKLSEKLGELNYERFQSFRFPIKGKEVTQAILGFDGDTYQGLEAWTMSDAKMKVANQKLRILSGLYGILRPTDLIRPYRLEMGTKVDTEKGTNLYKYWGDDLAEYLVEELKGKKHPYIVNCASEEYVKSIRRPLIKDRIIEVTFLDQKGDGPFKTISFYAKKARGMMARFIIDKKISDPSGLEDFDYGGYKFSKKESTEKNYVFKRSHKE